MIQITDVTARTALMPVSFHIMFIARSPKAAISDCRRSFGRYAPRIANSVNDGLRERKSLPDIDERSGPRRGRSEHLNLLR
jgi:hypothetical protein